MCLCEHLLHNKSKCFIFALSKKWYEVTLCLEKLRVKWLKKYFIIPKCMCVDIKLNINHIHKNL